MKNLFPHNQKAVDAIREAFKTKQRAAIVHATGTGKSYCLAEVARDYDRVLVVAPNTFVLDETRKVCHKGCEFRTYASVMYNEGDADKYDLIVLDEFHRGGAPEWSGGVARLIEANPKARMLGTSATHIRYLDNERNMADELFDGNVVSYLGLKDAIDSHILPNPTYVSTIYNLDSEITRLTEKIESANNSKDWKEDKLRHLDGIKDSWHKSNGVPRIIRKYFSHDMQRVIVFCSKVHRAAEARDILSDWFGKAGFERVRYYNIDYKEKHLEKEMADFQAPLGKYDLKVAISVNMLNEGIHVPHVDGIIMMRSTISRIIIEQQVGRCLTADNNAMIPVVLDLVNNMDTIRYDNKYTFTSKEYVRGDNTMDGTCNDGFPFKVIDECRDIRIFYEQLEDELITKGEDIEVHVERLLAWVSENGTVLYGSCPEYAWFKDLLREHRRDRFADVIKRLRDLGIQTPTEAFPRLSWDEKFKVFMDWKTEHNGKIPPVSADIGMWVHNQKTDFNHGRLREDRIDRVKNEMFIHVMTDDEVIAFLRNAIANKEDINKYDKGHGEVSAFIRKVKTTKYKLQHLDLAIELYNAGLKTNIPYTFEVGYDYVKRYFDAHIKDITRGSVLLKKSTDTYVRNWRIQIAKKYHKCTKEQQKLLNEMGIGKKIIAPLDTRLEIIEAEYSEKGVLAPRHKQWLGIHKDELVAKGMWGRAKAVGYVETTDSMEELMARFEEIHKDGRVRTQGELPPDIYSFIRREVRRDTKYGIRIREVGYELNTAVIERNKAMFATWMAENQRIPSSKKKDGKVQKDDIEYKCYVCMTTWSKCKTPELIAFVNGELAKYGLTYKAKGMTMDDYRNDFIRQVTDFRDNGGDYFSLHKTDTLFNRIDKYRRKALQENDTEIIELLNTIGAMITKEERIAINVERDIRQIAEYLSKGGVMSTKYKRYGRMKSLCTRYKNGRVTPDVVEVLKKYHFILEDGTFCNYIGMTYPYAIK